MTIQGQKHQLRFQSNSSKLLTNSKKNSLNCSETPTYPNPKSKRFTNAPHNKTKQKYPLTNFTKSDTNTRNPSQETHKKSSKCKNDGDPDEKIVPFQWGK